MKMRDELEKIRRIILEQVDLSREVPDRELFLMIDRQVSIWAKEHLISMKEREEARRWIFNSLRKLDVLQELLEEPGITEIMVNGPDRIFYEKEGRIFHWNKTFSSNEKLDNVVQQIAAMSNRSVNEADPITDARLPDGSRVNIIMKPAALDGPYITIRRFAPIPMTLKRLLELKTLSEEIAVFLTIAVQAGYNIFVSGGTGSGKTTFLNALSQVIPKDERVVTIEDSAELQLSGLSNLVRLETRNATVNGTGRITIRDLIRTALRLRPDRIIVGEVRGAEALDLLQALNTGHDGGLSTGHGNSCTDMIRRLETMVLMGMDLPLAAVRGQICSGIDLFVQMGRLPDHSRKVLEIAETKGTDTGEIQLHTLYYYSGSGTWERTGMLQNRDKLIQNGYKEGLKRLYEKKEV